MRIRFALLLTFLAAAAHAQSTWTEMLRESAAALQRGDYQKALDTDEALIQAMYARLGEEEPATKAFAVVVAQKAIALAGLGKYDDALWYWRIAKTIYPEVAQANVLSFGAAGVFLLNAGDQPAEGIRRVGGQVRSPVVLKRVEPVYPEGARRARASGIVILESVIDATGMVRSARVLKSLPAPTLAYAASEALRQWRFVPATLDGKPVEVVFNLTINFKLKEDEAPKE